MFEKLKNSLKGSRTDKAVERLQEEQFYLQVVEELSKGIKRDGLWAMATADSEGNEEAAKALYIKYRVQSIKDEETVSVALAEAAESAAKKAELDAQMEGTLMGQRAETLRADLTLKGYISKKVSNEIWKIKEPSGGIHTLASLEELEEYAKSRI